MAKLSDFEAMTVEELIEWKLARKREVKAIEEGIRAAHAVYTRKVAEEDIQRRIKAAGLEGVVVTPRPAALSMEGQ